MLPEDPPVVTSAPESKTEKKDKRPSTAAFKVVPETRELRDRVRTAAADFGKTLDRSRPLTRPALQQMSQDLLQRLGLGEQYLGFTMVAISNEFWREQVQAIAFQRRLLLLPHCLKNAEGCPADYDEFGLDCKKCGACSVADFKIKAEELGYKVLVSEGTPIVLKIIVSGHVDAIVGVACLNVLEKALDKILLAGIPCVAAPLLSSNCRSTSVDDDWVAELIDLHTEPPQAKTRSYVHLMRAAHEMFEAPALEQLAPRTRARTAGNGQGPAGADPLVLHENIAYDWLAQGGKRSRPFITLAVYDALKSAPGTLSAEGVSLPEAVRRTALAIETFHKASLVHDDIEDDDTFRYGRETLHRQHGVSTAINVGDYLIGLGYRLVSRERKVLGGDCTADILDRLADAHLRLSEGQGAELLWRDSPHKALTALEALKIYALKTAPAFEAALYAGVRLAGPAEAYEKAVVDFSRHLGIAFQILNDLNDWQEDRHNKLVAGQDVLSARPTLLLALALEGSPPAEREELLSLVAQLQAGKTSAGADPGCELILERVRRIFTRAGVFEKAEKLIEKSRARAEAVADEVEPTELRELLYYLVDTVLDRPCPEPEQSAPGSLVQLSLVPMASQELGTA
ncbi:MAG: polyprenyl synthetase family protein [Planctomycetes bacterium]|nr:polyprenyl synthetase family protein [Planctomycetota bacterium]